MKKLIISTFFLPLSLLGQPIKEEAIRTFKEIVKCYYDKDCNKFLSFFGDSISILNKEIDNIFPISLITDGKKSPVPVLKGVLQKRKIFKII